MFPPISLSIHSKRYTIPSYYIVQNCEELEDYKLLCKTFITESKNSYTVLGNSFFIRNYVVFDRDKSEIGFFPKNTGTLKNEVYRARNDGKENTVYRILEGDEDGKSTTADLTKFGGLISTLDKLENGASEDIEYLIYILVGVDVILLTIIIAFLWKKRYVVATGEWQDLLEV